MDVALLGWREACLEVENSLEEDRGREERRTRLVDLRRRGLRGMETGRLSCLHWHGSMAMGPGSSLGSATGCWIFSKWMGVADVVWIGWSGWMCWCRRLVGIALLSLIHESLNAGFDCVLHLLHHLFRIEGWIGSSLSGLRCHWCWWIWHLRPWWLWSRWSGCGVSLLSRLMEGDELLKMLDMRLSLWSELLIENRVLLPKSGNLSLRLSLWLLIHHVTSAKLTLKSYRLRIPAKVPHRVRDVGKSSGKHGTGGRIRSKINSSNNDASTLACKVP